MDKGKSPPAPFRFLTEGETIGHRGKCTLNVNMSPGGGEPVQSARMFELGDFTEGRQTLAASPGIHGTDMQAKVLWDLAALEAVLSGAGNEAVGSGPRLPVWEAAAAVPAK